MTVKELQEELYKYPDDMKVLIEDVNFISWNDVDTFEVVRITGTTPEEYNKSPEGIKMLRIS